MRPKPRLLVEMLAIMMLSCALGTCAAAQSQVVEVNVHSPGLERNLLGDSADQKVAIYLPAAYRTEPNRHFATIYFLHGFADTPVKGVAEILQTYMDKLIAAHVIEPMIIAVPNGLNRYFGSFYTNSEVTGNWEDYVVGDVVAYIDSHYRTIPAADARGISGHSMGGYGALMLGFKHPDVFSIIYAMSPCCTILEGDIGPSSPIWSHTAKVKSPAELASALDKDFLLVVAIAMDAAFAPNRGSLPMLGDPPFRAKSEQQIPDPEVLQKFQSKIVATAVPLLLPQIFKLKGIYIEYGAEDEFTHIPPGAQAVSQELARAGVPHVLDVYQGGHGNRVRERIERRMLPWFSSELKH